MGPSKDCLCYTPSVIFKNGFANIAQSHVQYVCELRGTETRQTKQKQHRMLARVGIGNRLKQFQSDMAMYRKKGARDSSSENPVLSILVFNFIVRREYQMEWKNFEANGALWQTILGQHRIYMCRWSTALSKKHRFELSIGKKVSFTGAVHEPLLQSSTAQTTKDNGSPLQSSKSLCSRTSKNIFRKSLKRSQEFVRQGTIVSCIMVEGNIVTVSWAFTDDEPCDRYHQKLYAEDYTKNLLDKITQLLATVKCFVQFYLSGEFNTLKAHQSMEERRSTTLQKPWMATCTINVSCSGRTHIAVKRDWFKSSVCSELTAVHDC